MWDWMAELFNTFEAQLQFGLILLIALMGWMIFRAHRQITKLAGTSALIARSSEKMQGSLEKLEETGDLVERLTAMAAAMRTQLEGLETATSEITRRTEETGETLRSNLEEYRMAQGSTSAYRDYLQRMGMAPASDVEPILEALGDGASAVSAEGRVLYTNRAYADLTSIHPGATLEEIVSRCQLRAFDGSPTSVADLPESRVLAGASVDGELIRIRPAGLERDVILSINGRPARDGNGRVVAAVMLAREVSEEIAMAIEVRRSSSEHGRAAPVSWAV
ncbi:MAG: PAS domain-containing protein [Actinomycetota bacterium]